MLSFARLGQGTNVLCVAAVAGCGGGGRGVGRLRGPGQGGDVEVGVPLSLLVLQAREAEGGRRRPAHHLAQRHVSTREDGDARGRAGQQVERIDASGRVLARLVLLVGRGKACGHGSMENVAVTVAAFVENVVEGDAAGFGLTSALQAAERLAHRLAFPFQDERHQGLCLEGQHHDADLVLLVGGGVPERMHPEPQGPDWGKVQPQGVPDALHAVLGQRVDGAVAVAQQRHRLALSTRGQRNLSLVEPQEGLQTGRERAVLLRPAGHDVVHRVRQLGAVLNHRVNALRVDSHGEDVRAVRQADPPGAALEAVRQARGGRPLDGLQFVPPQQTALLEGVLPGSALSAKTHGDVGTVHLEHPARRDVLDILYEDNVAELPLLLVSALRGSVQRRGAGLVLALVRQRAVRRLAARRRCWGRGRGHLSPVRGLALSREDPLAAATTPTAAAWR
uniref:Uncharacterized protein n=1 Tax=Ixodes ricinus TaxID=34613 RepID=A0A6B0VCF3_IXORI